MEVDTVLYFSPVHYTYLMKHIWKIQNHKNEKCSVFLVWKLSLHKMTVDCCTVVPGMSNHKWITSWCVRQVVFHRWFSYIILHLHPVHETASQDRWCLISMIIDSWFFSDHFAQKVLITRVFTVTQLRGTGIVNGTSLAVDKSVQLLSRAEENACLTVDKMNPRV